MQNVVDKILYFNIISWFKAHLKKADKPFLISTTIVFIALNTIFLYSGVHFLFGDHDWTYLKNGINLSAGLFEGHFSQFILINLLTKGEIFPILNNFFGFLGFSIGVGLLARYWQIKHTVFHYTVFALFTALTPYILSFTYFAFLVIPVLSWNLFIVSALLISQKQTSTDIKKTFISVSLIVLALGGYPPVINLIAVALTARIFFDYIIQNRPLTALIWNYRWTAINIILAGIIYKLCLIYLSYSGSLNTQYYNLQAINISEYPKKFLLIIKDLFSQFTVTLPFITSTYKIILTSLSLIALIITLKISKNKLVSMILFVTVFLSALITLFLSTSTKEIEFSPRIDFFGFIYVMSFCCAILLSSRSKFIKNITLCLIFSAILLNIQTLFEAQKVWHLGFISEMKLFNRITKRFQKDPLFSPTNHYIIVQDKSISFRPRFYHTPFNHKSDDLLDISYVPSLATGVMLNYYSNKNYANATSYVYTFTPDTEIKQKLQTAKPWPHQSSISVGNYWILLILTQQGLNTLRQKYLKNP